MTIADIAIVETAFWVATALVGYVLIGLSLLVFAKNRLGREVNRGMIFAASTIWPLIIIIAALDTYLCWLKKAVRRLIIGLSRIVFFNFFK